MSAACHHALPERPCAVGAFLRRVVEAYCQTAPSLRSPFSLLHAIERHRPLLLRAAFPSPLHPISCRRLPLQRPKGVSGRGMRVPLFFCV
ncbi:hypothetical protein ETC02_02640 [Geobacillus sp. DSP4a]|nr:hypothetical protein [Geobacillus sp. DSP4a]